MINWWSNWQLQLLLTVAYFATWCSCVRTAWPGDAHRPTRVQESDGRFLYCTLLMLSAQHALMLYGLSFAVEVIVVWLVFNAILMSNKTSVFDGHLTMLRIECTIYFKLMKIFWFFSVTRDARFVVAVAEKHAMKAFCMSYITLLRYYAAIQKEKRDAIDPGTRNAVNKLETTLYTFAFVFWSVMPMRSFLYYSFRVLQNEMMYWQEQKTIKEQQVQNEKQTAIAESVADWLEKPLARI
jgi:hypothetical protein